MGALNIPRVLRFISTNLRLSSYQIHSEFSAGMCGNELEDFEAAVGRSSCYYNFCKVYGAIPRAPPQAAVVESSNEPLD